MNRGKRLTQQERAEYVNVLTTGTQAVPVLTGMAEELVALSAAMQHDLLKGWWKHIKADVQGRQVVTSTLTGVP
jgi:hypothetical protein